MTVVVAGRRAEPLDEVAAQSPRIVPIVADVSAEADVRRLFDETVQRFGRLDLLFNNAGTGAHGDPVRRAHARHLDAVLSVTLTGSFLCAREAFRIMRTQNRRVAASSTTARSPRTHRVRCPRPTRSPSTRWPDHEAAPARRAPLRHRLRTDRHRQRRHHDGVRRRGRHAPGGRLDAPDRRWTSPRRAVRSRTWPHAAGTNVPNLTVMPTPCRSSVAADDGLEARGRIRPAPPVVIRSRQ